MNRVERTTELVLEVDPGPDGDAEEAAELALRLRDELDELDGVSARLAHGGPPPSGSKGAGAVEWGTLVVQLLSSGALTALLTSATGWVARNRRGTVRVKLGDDELELTGATSEEQQHLVADWLERRDRAPRGDG
jgi:hypothetical protein